MEGEDKPAKHESWYMVRNHRPEGNYGDGNDTYDLIEDSGIGQSTADYIERESRRLSQRQGELTPMELDMKTLDGTFAVYNGESGRFVQRQTRWSFVPDEPEAEITTLRFEQWCDHACDGSLHQ